MAASSGLPKRLFTVLWSENVLELYAACRAANVGLNVRVLAEWFVRRMEFALRKRSLSNVAAAGDAPTLRADLPYDVVPAKSRDTGGLSGVACGAAR